MGESRRHHGRSGGDKPRYRCCKAAGVIGEYCTEESNIIDRNSSNIESSPKRRPLKYTVICDRLRAKEKRDESAHFTRDEQVFFGREYVRLKRAFDQGSLANMCRRLSKDLPIWAKETNRQNLVHLRTADKIHSVLLGQLKDRGVKGWLYRKHIKQQEQIASLGRSDYSVRLEEALPEKNGLKRKRYDYDSDSSFDVEPPRQVMRVKAGRGPLFFTSDEESDLEY